MTGLSIDSKTVTEMVFFNVQSHKGDYVKIVCNAGGCAKVFWEGLDTDAPSVDWLALAAVHIQDKHPEVWLK